MTHHIPLIEVGSGASDEAASQVAGEVAAHAAAGSICHHVVSVTLVYVSSRHDLNAVLEGVHLALGDVPVIGVTTAGELCEGMQQNSVVVVVLASPHLRVHAAVGQHVSTDWRAALDEALANPSLQNLVEGNTSVWQERMRHGTRLFAMIFGPGNTRHAMSPCFEIIEVFKARSLGGIPVFAGAAADDWHMESNAVLLGRQAYPDGLLVALFETELDFGIALGNGFRPGQSRTIASAVEGHEILKLDGRPAAEVLAEQLGSNVAALTGQHITLTTGRTFGTKDPMGQYSLNVAAYLTPRGGVRMSQPVPVGAELIWMEPDNTAMVSAGQDTLRKAMLRAGTSQPAVVLCHYCALRPRIMGDEYAHQEVAGIKALANGSPLAGFCSFGEGGLSDDGVSRHNNASVAILVLSLELSGQARVAKENERLRAELKAQTDLRLLGEALRQTDEAFIVVDAQRCFRYVNPAFTHVFGYTPEEVMGKPIELMAPRSENSILDTSEVVRHTLEHSAFRGEVLRRAKDGRMVPVLLNVAPLRDESNLVTGYIGVLTDLRESKKAEAILRENEAKLRGLYELSPLGIVLTDINGHFIEFNEAFRQICGYPADELKQLAYWALTPREYEPKEREQLHLLARTGRYGPYQKEYQRQDGTRVPIELHGMFIANAGGKQHIWSIVEDITQRKLQEEKQLELMRELNTILDNSCVAITFVENRKQRWASRHMEEMFGYSLAEMKEQSTRMFYPSQDAYEQFGAEAYPILASGGRFTKELEMLRRNGTRFWGRVSGKAVNAENPVAGSIWILEDISDRKRAEQQAETARVYAENLIHAANVMIVELDLAGALIVFNPVAEQITGYTLAELQGRNWFETLVPRERYPEVWAAFERFTAGELIPHFENPILTKGGEERYIAWRNSTVLVDGQVVGSVSFGMDVTDLRKLARRLAEAQRIAHVGSWELDHVSEQMAWSDEFTRLLEVAPGHLAAPTWESFIQTIHPDDRKQVEDLMVWARTFKQPFEVQCRLSLEHDMVKHIALQGECEFTVDDSPLRTYGTAQDVTDRVLQEEMVRESELRFRTIVDFTYDWEYWEGTRGEILYMSPSCERISGYSRLDFITNPGLLKQIVHSEDQALFKGNRSDPHRHNWKCGQR